MKTFNDLEFKERYEDIIGNVAAKLDFPNGFGVSVIRSPYSYGGDKGLYELAVMYKGRLHYDNPVALGDVRGHLTPQEVTKLMRRVQRFGWGFKVLSVIREYLRAKLRNWADKI